MINLITQRLTESVSQWASYFCMPALGRLKIGELVVSSVADNKVYTFGEPGTLSASLTVLKKTMWMRVMFGSSIVILLSTNVLSQ